MEQSVKPSTEENFLYYAIKYKTALIATLVLLISLGAGTFFWVRQQKVNELEAAMQLSRIAPLLDVGEYGVAINGKGHVAGLKKIAEEYSGKYTGTPSGNMANLLLANAWYSSKEYDKALSVFKTVSMENNDLAAAALAGTGDCYFNKNQFAKAAESYQEASKKADNSALKAQYLTNAAKSFQESKQLAKASELYTKIIADYPGSTGAVVAQRSLWQISGNL
ncbi:MAG: tetratricopeptide repeat protein [Chlorobium sp.]|nr:MAG: tetratricopeptide repeat protein [Chlorobium sp.]